MDENCNRIRIKTKNLNSYQLSSKILQLSTCQVPLFYVDIRCKFVDMQLNYVDIQVTHVDEQLKLTCEINVSTSILVTKIT